MKKTPTKERKAKRGIKLDLAELVAPDPAKKVVP